MQSWKSRTHSLSGANFSQKSPVELIMKDHIIGNFFDTGSANFGPVFIVPPLRGLMNEGQVSINFSMS